MSLTYHPWVQRDINEALDYYAENAPASVDEFWCELNVRINEIRENPQRFGFYRKSGHLRRAKLRKFPYLVLFYRGSRGLRVTCVKHVKRHPSFGILRR